ncbi:hypothetical protein [Pseudomonas soli]|uniref:hypothetical protein n=1 Tax=Pseudomonas soli TaxID=1306993 RepID=UPI00345D51BA
MIEVIEDIIGINEAGLVCHPYKYLRGEKKGLFSYTFENDNTTFKVVTEDALRKMIEAGMFNERGRIFMLPAGSVNVKHNGALRVKRYKDELLPVRVL